MRHEHAAEYNWDRKLQLLAFYKLKYSNMCMY